MTVTEESPAGKRMKYSFEDIETLIRYNNLEGLKAAFELDGFDVNMKDQNGTTALHSAALYGNGEILEVLLSHPHINIDAKDQYLETPLMYAVKFEYTRSLKILLENGADASCSNDDGLTALWYASNSDNLKIAEALLKSKNCVPNTEEKEVYDFMYNSKIIDLVAKFILESPNDPYYFNTFGYTVLYHGCRNGLLKKVKFIVEKENFDINVRKEYNSRTPLQTAVVFNSLEIADYLIQKGASLTFKDSEGKTAYDYAAEHDDSETFLEKYEPEKECVSSMFKILIQNYRFKTFKAYAEKCISGKYADDFILMGACLFASKYEYADSFPSFLAQITNRDFIVRLADEFAFDWKFREFEASYKRILALETSDAEIKKIQSKLFLTSMYGQNDSTCEYLLEEGLPANYVEVGSSFLIKASKRNDTELIEMLLKHGANVNHVNRNLKSALYHATIRNNLYHVQLLLNNGADPHVRDIDGDSPLLLAAYNGHTEVFFELFKVDQNIHQRSNYGITPFLAACYSGNLKIIETLIEAGACLTDVDESNQNCLHYVADNDNVSCETMVYLFENLGKRDFMTMVVAIDRDGLTPLDCIQRNSGYKKISELMLAIPDLNDLIIPPAFIKIDTSNQENQEMCLICRDNFTDGDSAIVLQCKHMYHEDCFSEWSKAKGVCPYCQRPAHEMKNK